MSIRTSSLRTLALTGAALLAASPVQAQAPLPTAQQVVARYVEAIGGERAIAAQQFRHVQAEMSMPAMGMTATMEAHQARQGNKFRMKMEMPGMGAMNMGYDGQTAWSVNPMQGPKVLEGRELTEAMRQYDFDANMRFTHLFPKMETVGRAQVSGESCVNVKMTTATGEEVTNCFAEDDGLLIGATARANTEAGSIESTMTFTEYKEFGGLKMPTLTTVSTMGQQMLLRVKNLSTAPIDPTVFALPAEVAALKK